MFRMKSFPEKLMLLVIALGFAATIYLAAWATVDPDFDCGLLLILIGVFCSALQLTDFIVYRSKHPGPSQATTAMKNPLADAVNAGLACLVVTALLCNVWVALLSSKRASDLQDEARTQQERMFAKILKTQKSFASVSGSLARLEVASSQLEGRVRALDTSLTTIAKQVEKVELLSKNLEGVQSLAQESNTRMVAVNTTLSGVDTTLSGVNTTLSGVNTTLAGLKPLVDGYDELLRSRSKLLAWIKENL